MKPPVLLPIPDKDGGVLLYDIFVSGLWIGSRRTIQQATQALAHQGWPSAVMATGDYKIVHEHDGSRIIFDHEL